VRLLNSLIKQGLRQALHPSELAGAGETAGFLVIGPRLRTKRLRCGPPSNKASVLPGG
jgi:hypothetical protein